MKRKHPEELLRDSSTPTSLRVAIQEMLVIQSLYDVMYTHYTQHGDVDENLAGLIQDHMAHLVSILSRILHHMTEEDIPF